MRLSKHITDFLSKYVDNYTYWHNPDVVLYDENDKVYLRRWHYIPRNRLFNIYFHEFLNDDFGREMHSHPWHSISFVIKGNYWERLKFKFGALNLLRKEGDILFRSPNTFHRISLERERFSYPLDAIEGSPVPARTIFLTGPKITWWGFDCPNGIKHWKDYLGIEIENVRHRPIPPGCGEY